MAILTAIGEAERSKQTVTIAHDLAAAYDDKLVAVHVVPEEDYDEHKASIEEIPDFTDFSLSQEEESAKRFARRFLDETVENVDPEMVEARGRVGDVAGEILAEAERVDPRYLVIGGRRRSPAGKAIFGNTAQKILLNAHCPVVTKMDD